MKLSLQVDDAGVSGGGGQISGLRQLASVTYTPRVQGLCIVITSLFYKSNIPVSLKCEYHTTQVSSYLQ